MMSKYTITIKNLMDNNFNFNLQTYPIFDENYRPILNRKILYHYYEREIGFETPALFRLYLNNTLNEIMPFYNNLYNAQQEALQNIFNNIEITENLTGKDKKVDSVTTSSSSTNLNNTNVNTDSQSSNNAETNNKNLFQDTPQGNIDTTAFENQTWATNLTLEKNNSNSNINDVSHSYTSSDLRTTDNVENNLNSNSTNEYVKNIVGRNGNKYTIEILNDVKQNLMNIDLLIINELDTLFMQIY